jgi:hypothetical protein
MIITADCVMTFIWLLMQTHHLFFRHHFLYLRQGVCELPPIARTSGGGDTDLVYGENSLLRHVKNKNTFRTQAN